MTREKEGEKGRGRGEREGKEVERTGGQRAERRGRERGRGGREGGEGLSGQRMLRGGGGVRSSSPALSSLESPWFSAHSLPGLLIALATPWSHLWTSRVFCFLGSPHGFQHVLVLKVGSPHTQQHHLGAEMQIPGPPQDLCFTPPSVGGGRS